jgi:GNAT superfamily N-acetyltransferase
VGVSLSASIPPGVILRHDLRPGDMGAIIGLHGMIYAQEYGFDQTFEGYVAAGLAEFAQAFDPGRDRIWVAEQEGHITGSIAILSRSAEEAQLRWFLIHPESRGLGLGRRMLKEALGFCREKGYRRIYLWTIQNLVVATHLYQSSGFIKTGEKLHPLWGKMIHEECYQLDLTGR